MLLIKDGFKTATLLMLATITTHLFTMITASHTHVAIIYMLAIFLIARFTSGYIWGALSSIVGVFGVNYFFTAPFFELDFTRSGYPLTFFGLLTISFITSGMTTHIKEHSRLIAKREEMTNQLNEINSYLLTSESIEQIIAFTLEHISKFAKTTTIFHKKDPLEEEDYIIYPSELKKESFLTTPYNLQLAHLAFNRQLPVDDQLHSPNHELYLPLLSHNQIWGVVGIDNLALIYADSNTLTFIKLMLNQVAMAIERQHLIDQHHALELESEKEKMKANLLRAVSHDLRTPLTGIIGNAATYLENKAYLSEADSDQLMSLILEDANWLLHMVENLLSITRIKEGPIKVSKKLEPVEEVVSEAIARFKKRYPNCLLNIKVPDTFLMIALDATLIEQVILNLLENAAKYARSTTPIELIVLEENQHVVFKIIDHGIGLDTHLLDHIFDGYGVNPNPSSDSSKGMGIGLSICKTIIRAHSGDITANNYPSGGAEFTFSLPIEILEGENLDE